MNKSLTGIQKLCCTVVSALVPVRKWRHKVRYMLNPLNDKRCVSYFAKRYAARYAGRDFAITPARTLPAGSEPLWMCWLQGERQMPELVKRCVHSVEKHKTENQQIFIITEENHAQYITLPDFIVTQRRQVTIGNAHFADIIRVYLLAAYGGYWIDATCLMTGSFPEEISEQPFFMYHSQGEFAYTLIQNCFIHAAKGNYLITRWAQLMTALWREECRLLHYFQHHLMFKAMITVDERARKEYESMPHMDDKAMHTIQEWAKNNVPLSPERLAEAARNSFIHKLTYKIAVYNGLVMMLQRPCNDVTTAL